tara:strand:+ start:308 stop:838 length:531 start_codon:yes stop_codon:yes gene_type:complete
MKNMDSNVEVDINKKLITQATVSSYLSIIAQKMKNDNFMPDIVIGLSRGGLPPGIMMSHYLKKPFIPFETALRDFPVWKSNTTALGSVKKVLVIDDICDTGDTFKKLKDELSKELPDLDVKFASLHYNKPASFKPNWYGTLINKDIDDVWVVYPWEDWWERDTIENTLVNEMLGNI